MATIVSRQFALAALVLGLVVAACTTSAPTPPPAAPAKAGLAVAGGGGKPNAGRSGATLGQRWRRPAAHSGHVAADRWPGDPDRCDAELRLQPDEPSRRTWRRQWHCRRCQPAQPPSVSGTLSRIPTPIPAPQGPVTGIIATATAAAGGGVAANLSVLSGGAGGGGGGGGGGGAQNVPAVQTATPPIRSTPQAQPTIAFPGR